MTKGIKMWQNVYLLKRDDSNLMGIQNKTLLFKKEHFSSNMS